MPPLEQAFKPALTPPSFQALAPEVSPFRGNVNLTRNANESLLRFCCKSKVKNQKSKMIRVATYNVHKCRGMDRRTHPERIAEVLRATNADAIACQEILAAQVDDITRALPGYSA